MTAKLCDLKRRLEALDERFATGEVEEALYEKIASKLNQELTILSTEIKKSSLNILSPNELLGQWGIFTTDLVNLWTAGDGEEKLMVQDILFPNGIVYNRKNETFRPSCVNTVLKLIAFTSKKKNKSSQQALK